MVDPNKHGVFNKEGKLNKWLSFKFVSSFILLVVTTIWSIMYDTGVNSDLWFCMWALCVVRFVDVVDEIGGSDEM